MDSLRWILLFAGLGLLVILYLVGRKRSASDADQDLFSSPQTTGDPLYDPPSYERADYSSPPMPAIQDDSQSQTDVTPEIQTDDSDDLLGLTEDLEALNSILAEESNQHRSHRSGTLPHVESSNPTSNPTSNLSHPPEEEKIIAIHLVAKAGECLHGVALKRVFEERAYQFGDLDIYHSLHGDKTVFSIVNMVKPGWFDPQSMDDFETPGISLFLQLPGPLAANVAFDVLINEAHALADALEANLEDDTHSTLSAQRIQHIRDDLREYMFKQQQVSGHHAD